ncbi:MAG: DUF6062 family protein [Clostridium sp.]|nr:DUF6062 family protein [Clostridium sp.]
MKEQLYTIPLNDAVNTRDECPFCYIERNIERDLLDFVLGSGASYMEADVRDATDQAGFCRTHFKKMFDYGNALGNAWILKTHYQKTLGEMKRQFSSFRPGKVSFKDKFRRNAENGNTVGMWIRSRENSCYICNHFREAYARYLDTFFEMYQKDGPFREKISRGKGFCLPHFASLCEAADTRLGDQEKESFYRTVFAVMEANMERISGDVAWLVEKFDYRNQGADWKDSRDALQRGMQKLKGGYPADPVYRMKK